MVIVCPECGPWVRRFGQTLDICPTCDLDIGEHHYRNLIMRVGGAEVYRREYRRARGLPAVAT